MEFFGILIIGALYFLPTIVASSKNKQNTGAIFALNLLLGWTVIGWILAFIWALTQDANPQPSARSVAVDAPKSLPPQQAPAQRKCPDCAEMVLAEARKCRFCGQAISIQYPIVEAGKCLRSSLPPLPYSAEMRVLIGRQSFRGV